MTGDAHLGLGSSLAFGLEAFATGYAGARRLALEDSDELRRRIALPYPGWPEYSMRGLLAGAVDGRLVIWRDHLETGDRCWLNVALAPAGAAATAPTPPFELHRLDGWLAVAERVDASGVSIARLDALAAEAARLAR